MRPGGSNRKGGGFEREVCRKLTLWITGKPKPEILWRSATSGAKATQDAKQGLRSGMGSDLVSVDPRSAWLTNAYSIEIKFRASFGSLRSLVTGKGGLCDWWMQVCADSVRDGRKPFLIFKQNRSPIFGMLPIKQDGFASQGPSLRLPKPRVHILSLPIHGALFFLDDLLADNHDLVRDWGRD